MTAVTTVPRVDLGRYLGRWFEICRLPLKWEDETASDITASYALNDDGKIRVDNRCFNCGFRRRRDGFHWRFNDRRRFHHFRFYHHRLGVERRWRDSLRRFDSRRFGDQLLRRWLDGCWRDTFRSINHHRLGGYDRLDDHRLGGNRLHGSRLDGDRGSGNGFNDGNRGRDGRDGFHEVVVLNLNLFRLLILRTNHRVADPDFTGSHLRRCAGYGQRHWRLGRIAFVTIATTTLTADAQVTRGTT